MFFVHSRSPIDVITRLDTVQWTTSVVKYTLTSGHRMHVVVAVIGIDVTQVNIRKPSYHVCVVNIVFDKKINTYVYIYMYI